MKIVKTITLVLFVLLVAVLFYLSHQSDEKYFRGQFEGEVKSIHISVKGYHTVELTDGNSIYLGYYRSCIHDMINIGDIVKKEKASWELKIMRKQRGEYEIVEICNH